MSFRDQVLEDFPQAFAVEVPPVLRRDAMTASQPGYWVIYADAGHGSDELARGMTQDQAWEGAAMMLKNIEVEAVAG